ncbi:MAG: hypothetical protein E7378_04690 [Clostridiales bacterium]|nr:hypothetical protein [Clostridiales bacterium]
MFGEILAEVCLDTLKAVPILYLVYLLVSYFEHNSHRYVNFFKKAKKFGPVVGATVGTIPQCGFSVAMADMYNKKNITLGTLVAVFIATSDEAIPLMFADYSFIVPMLIMITIKFVYAILCGYAIDAILKLAKKKRENKMELAVIHSHEACECGHEEHNHEHTNHCCADNIFLDALKHTLKIVLFIFIVNLAFGLIIGVAGFDISSLNSINKFVQPLITSLIGLIPNCAASVLLVEAYMLGGISFGALLAGLATSAGVGILTLFKINKKQWGKNLLVLLLVYGLGVLLGTVLNLTGINLVV